MQDPFDLAELAVGFLQRGRSADEDVHTDVVTDGHLVGESAEIPLQLGHARGQLVTTTSKINLDGIR
jgi:hypothetical protein